MITISTDKNLLEIEYIHQFLSKTYWASDRTVEDVKESINNSLCFGMYLDEKQIGFARIVTDKVVFSYLMDVFTDEKHQGQGYGKMLISYIYNHKDLIKVRKNYLMTKYAQEFYTNFGFIIHDKPNRFMLKVPHENKI
jgi:N-acetylglutamate synthase-like GNAT family acetyltransferase